MKYGYIALALLLANTLKLVRTGSLMKRTGW